MWEAFRETHCWHNSISWSVLWPFRYINVHSYTLHLGIVNPLFRLSSSAARRYFKDHYRNKFDSCLHQIPALYYELKFPTFFSTRATKNTLRQPSARRKNNLLLTKTLSAMRSVTELLTDQSEMKWTGLTGRVNERSVGRGVKPCLPVWSAQAS